MAGSDLGFFQGDKARDSLALCSAPSHKARAIQARFDKAVAPQQRQKLELKETIAKVDALTADLVIAESEVYEAAEKLTKTKVVHQPLDHCRFQKASHSQWSLHC